MSVIKVHDKYFTPYISELDLLTRIHELAQQIDQDYAGKQPIFLGILNGSFQFAACLFKKLKNEAEISFVKLASYHGTSSSGEVVTTIGLDESLHNRHVIILEDIIDTGRTMHHFVPQLQQQGVASVEIATLLTKPDALEFPVNSKYVGFEIPNQFVLGFGLDYDGLGRNLEQLYVLCDPPAA